MIGGGYNRPHHRWGMVMFRVLYTLIVVSLLGASAVMASAIDDRQEKLKGGAGFVLMTSLRR